MTVKYLDDLFHIKGQVKVGDFVVVLGDAADQAKNLVDSYVVTEQLATCFDTALGLIKSGLAENKSIASYLDGSFGSGKSHFMAVLHAILNGVPEARGKKGLTEIVARHDAGLNGRRFLQVTQHMVDADSLEAAVLGGYVDTVRRLHPDARPPAVYRDDKLLENARQVRQRRGDTEFIAELPVEDDWGGQSWDAATLDAAFSAPHGDPERQRLVEDLLASIFTGYGEYVSNDARAFIELDKGLSVISRHAREVLGYDAIILLLDELVLWLSKFIGDTTALTHEAQKISKLTDSAERARPAPIISFVPRQRDLRELVGRDATGSETTSLFDNLKYWDGRFHRIELADTNLPVIIRERLLRPKDEAAETALDEAFHGTANNSRTEIWDTLVDAQGGHADRTAFRASYPFSPALLHIMVDVSGALQRERTALTLLSQLLNRYRNKLPLGQLMPAGAIFSELTDGKDDPFTEKLRGEFNTARNFYDKRLRPHLLDKHNLSEAAAAKLPAKHQFVADDLVVKTLLLAALVPAVPALRNLTAGRLAALNHGSIASIIPGADRGVVAQTLKDLNAEFAQIQVSGGDDPTVEMQLIGVDVEQIITAASRHDTPYDRRNLVKRLLWTEFGISDLDGSYSRWTVPWRGTERSVEVAFTNVRESVEASFLPDEPGAMRILLDYPFDEGHHYPRDDENKVREIQRDATHRLNLSMAWLPTFLSDERQGDLGKLVIVEYLLNHESLLPDYSPHLTSDERYHAKSQLNSRRDGLTNRITDALRQAYGLAQRRDSDLGAGPEHHLLAAGAMMNLGKPPAGASLPDALRHVSHVLLEENYPEHPDLDPDGKNRTIKRAELKTVLDAVEGANADPAKRLEVDRVHLPVLRRLANPLEIATVDEVFVLRDDWLIPLARKAAAEGVDEEISVGQLQRWIVEETPGLPPGVVDLLVCCYAVVEDRSWRRAGHGIQQPELGKLHADMVLRKQALPSRPDFDAAAKRATAIFGTDSRPAFNSRSVAAIARQLRERTREVLPDVEALQRELHNHATTLGIEAESARQATVTTMYGLLNDLASRTDDTRLMTELATAELPKDAVYYRACLDNAKALSDALAHSQWDILDSLPDHAASGGTKAEPAENLLQRLRAAANRDEHEQPLGKELGVVAREAMRLLATVDKTTPVGTGTVGTPGDMPPVTPIGGVTRRISGSRAHEVLDQLSAELDAHPDAWYEISWRRVDPT